MIILLKILLIIYALGFPVFLALNLTIGPVTPALALLRAVLWPLWVVTGIPHGVPV